MGEAISLKEFQAEAAAIDQAKNALEERLRALVEAEGVESPELLDEAVLAALRARLRGPLDESERREIILLVLSRVIVQREAPQSHAKAKVTIEHKASATSSLFYL